MTESPLAKFLKTQKPNAVSPSQTVPVNGPAVQVVPAAVSPSPVESTALTVEKPLVEESKVSAAADSSSQVPTTPEPVSPAKPSLSAIGKMLSTPKPVVVQRIPPPEKFEGMMLEDISNLTDVPVDIHAGERFKYQLDLLDDKIQKDADINQFTIDGIRNLVARIMIDWKENPDYDKLVGPEHVHKIMKFMWKTQERAIEMNAEKAIKADKKATTQKRRAGTQKAILDMSSIDMDF